MESFKIFMDQNVVLAVTLLACAACTIVVILEAVLRFIVRNKWYTTREFLIKDGERQRKVLAVGKKKDVGYMSNTLYQVRGDTTLYFGKLDKVGSEREATVVYESSTILPERRKVSWWKHVFTDRPYEQV